MFDESLLGRVLSQPAHEAPARVIDEMMHLAQSAEYSAAAERAADLLESGSKDMRSFVAYALGVFAERGPGAIPALFEPMTALLSTRHGGSGPSSPALTTDTTLRFCFRIMKAHLDFDERRAEHGSKAWLERFESNSAASVLRACENLRKALREFIDVPRSEDELEAVTARLEEYCNRSPRGSASRPDENEVEPAREPAVFSKETEKMIAAVDEPTPSPPAAAVSEAQPAIAVSPALRQFMRKLRVFEQLMADGSLGKAAIVAHDIRQIVENFDPMVYLPDLLTEHFRLLSSNVDRLGAYWEQVSAPNWRALEQLYRVDIEAFLEA